MSADVRKRAELSAEDKKIRNRKRYLRRRTLRRILTGILVVGVVIELCVGIFAVRFLQKNLAGKPVLDPKDFISEESTKIYDSEGTLLTEIGTYYRENITYDQCPESLVDAFLAVEDSRYFEHNGFDIPRFTKAIIETLARHNTQGGSTFTMQLVKNTYFSIDAGDNSVERDATIQYKIQQIWLSMELERIMDKKKIFELYVNKLNFGERVRGVEKASQYYFGKHCTDLNITESAMLAGIVNLPNGYNPYRFLDEATKRRNEVLYSMQMHGYITEEEYDLARSVKLEDLLVGEDKLEVEKTKYPEYVDAVIQEAQELTGYDPVVKGMEIHTAMIPAVQDRIEAIEASETSVSFADDLMQTAIISMNNQTGEIVALGGGRNYGESGGSRLLNRALSAYKQPGSSVKPFLDYALAFEYLGYSIDEILVDKPITFPGESRVLVNANGEYEGDVTIKDAVAKSLNIPAILTLEKVVTKIGQNNVVSYLNRLGFKKANNSDFHLSYAIGGNALETTVTELAGAHAAMINLGIYNKPHTIDKIILTDGTEVLPAHQNERVLSSGSAYLASMLMQNNVESIYFNYMQILRRHYPVYAKTGTTDWGSDGVQYGIPKGAAKDKWMVSSTSQFTNAVWVGYDMAVKDKGTYFPYWKSAMNIPGKINKELLDIEEEVSPETLGGIEMPEDAVVVSYVRGTNPHVAAESWMPSYAIVTSIESQAGLDNSPLISAQDYRSGAPELQNFSAAVSNGLMYINWYAQNTCSGGERDISLHDPWNDIEMTGACLADTSWLINTSGTTYVADIYENDVYLTTIYSDTGEYSGLPAYFNGDIKACGYYSNSRGTSETICTYAGYWEQPEGEESE